MRNTLFAGAVGGLFFAVAAGAVIGPQSGSGLKIGYIDSQAVIGAYPGTMEAQTQFNAENAAWESRAQELQNDINRLNSEIERLSMTATPERRAQLNADLQRRSMEYQQFINTIWGQEGQAYQRNQELMKPIIDKVNALLETVGEEDAYDFILDASTGTIVHANPAYDLTPRIIDLMRTADPGPQHD